MEPRGMETDSNDSQKNAVFGIVVSNAGRKGAPQRVSGLGEFTTSTHSSDRFLRLFIVLPFWSSMIHGAVIFSKCTRCGAFQVQLLGRVSSLHLK